MVNGGHPPEDHRMDTTTEPPPDPAAPESAPSPPARPRLLRSADDRVLGGVAAGIAEHFGVEPLVIRLAFLVAAFFGGLGVIAYLALWVILPRAVPSAEPPPRDHRQLLGYGLVAFGLAVIPGRLGLDLGFGDGAFWPLALIATGGAVLWLRTRDGVDASDVETVAAPAPPAPPATADPTIEPRPAFAPSPAPQPSRAPKARKPPKPPKGPVTAITLSALLILGGVTWLVIAAGWASVDVGVVAAIALTIVGAGLVTSAWIGRARGLVVVGILLAFVVGVAGAIDVPIRGGIGDATYRPTTQAAVRDRYRMAIGRLELDFRETRFAGRRTEVTATVGLGRLVVRVPDDVRLVVRGHAGVGSVSLFGRERGDCCPTDKHLVRAGQPGRGTLVLDVRVGAGAVDVTDNSNVVSSPRITPTAPPAPTTPPTPTAPPAPTATNTRIREARDAAA